MADKQVKQVILIRRDLKMRRGKEIAQGSHASIQFLVSRIRYGRIEPSSTKRRSSLFSRFRGSPDSDCTAQIELSESERHWITEGMGKICLQVQSEEELVRYHEAALERGLISHLIRDSGRTEFGGRPTLTACAIGPAEADSIDAVTGELKLY